MLRCSLLKSKIYSRVHKSIKQSYVFKHYYEREKSSFVINS